MMKYETSCIKHEALLKESPNVVIEVLPGVTISVKQEAGCISTSHWKVFHCFLLPLESDRTWRTGVSVQSISLSEENIRAFLLLSNGYITV